MDKFVKDTGSKKMWALRLSKVELQMLKECAAVSDANMTDLVRFWIRSYHQEHVAPNLVAKVAKKRPAKPSSA